MLAMLPPNEEARQAAVDRSCYGSLRGSFDLDRIVQLLSRSYDAPLAALSIIDRMRQVLVSREGIEVDFTPRDEAFCAVAIHKPGETLLVADAQKDARFCNYRPVLNDPHIRFYAGKPVLSHDGYALGALCIADVVPRSAKFDPTRLLMLASEVERLLWK